MLTTFTSKTTSNPTVATFPPPPLRLDVTAAVSEQNIQVAVGELGGTPSPKGTELNATVNTESRLTTPEQFANILLRVNPDGSSVRIKDVGRVELGGADYSTLARINGKPASAIAIKLSPTGNALATATAVRAKMDELQRFFPPDYEFSVPYDTSAFVKISIEEVVKTLAEAVILVFLVMYLFLQNFRATVIPVLAVFVSIIGTFGVMLAMHFSINTLTLLGLVLAIGIVVDDAIVVVENVERKFEHGEKDPHKATSAAMKEVAGPIIATTLSLAAVFVPAALMPGVTGQLYNQFAMTIAVSVVLSGINSLTLSPALAAIFLRPREPKVTGPFGAFNKAFARTERASKFAPKAA